MSWGSKDGNIPIFDHKKLGEQMTKNHIEQTTNKPIFQDPLPPVVFQSSTSEGNSGNVQFLLLLALLIVVLVIAGM